MGRVTNLINATKPRRKGEQPQGVLTTAQFEASIKLLGSHLQTIDDKIKALENPKGGKKHGN